jgi:PEP-CTERM motif
VSNQFTGGWISRRVRLQSLLVVALLLVCAARAAADPLRIDTVGPDGLPNVIVGSFGEPNAATVGQTFIAPANARRLDRFTFYLFYVEGGPARFSGHVGNWDGAKVTEPLLYASAERQLTTPLTPIPVTFETGGVPVTPGRSYVAFLSASMLFDGLDDNTNLFLEGDTYTVGGHVALANGGNFSEIFTRNWRGLDPLDLAFVAEFTPVPEPSTMLLFGTGAASIAAAARRRRRASAS